MDEVERLVKRIEVHCRIPALQWVRLQSLCEVKQCDVTVAMIVALGAGLDALGVPATVDGLLDADGRLQVGAQEAELAKRWEANYIYAEEDPAEEEGT